MFPSPGTTVEQNRKAAPSGRVSVIIPAYNAAPFIKETIESVFAQTYPYFEVIVVNDGSPDTPELESVLAPYLDRVSYIRQENRGLAGARNTGLTAATGEFVALLDADDIWLPNYLQRQVHCLNDGPDLSLVYCNARFFGDSFLAGKEYMQLCPSEGEATATALISRRCHVFVSVTARTEALRAVGFDESLRSCEDFDCWIRFVAAGFKIGYHREVLVLYRKRKASLSTNQKAMAEFGLRVLGHSLSLWPDDSEEAMLLRRAATEKKAELENIKGKLALVNRDFTAARAHFQASNSHYQSSKLRAIILLLRFVPSLVRATYTLRKLAFPAYLSL
jgi:glycosyltransferase involved in cell wall biosynthesis